MGAEVTMETELKKLQKVELNMLKEIHTICEAHRIKYFLIAGTLLGAVRHGGFIPWDDDIDIGMPRPDYDKFAQIARQKLPECMDIQAYNSHNYYPINFIKVIDKRTRLIEEARKDSEHVSGVYIDVFPIDGSPNNRILRKLHYLHVKIYRLLIAYCCCNESIIKDNGLKRMIKLSIMHIVKILEKLGFLKISYLHKKLDNLLKKYDYDSSLIVCNYLGGWGQREFVPKEYIGKGAPIMFEGHVFWGVEKPHDYLVKVYGDYMKLPPEEERKSHHSFSILEL